MFADEVLALRQADRYAPGLGRFRAWQGVGMKPPYRATDAFQVHVRRSDSFPGVPPSSAKVALRRVLVACTSGSLPGAWLNGLVS